MRKGQPRGKSALVRLDIEMTMDSTGMRAGDLMRIANAHDVSHSLVSHLYSRIQNERLAS